MFDQILSRQQMTYAIAGLALIVIVLFVWYVGRKRTSRGGIAGADLGELIRRLRTTNAQWLTIAADCRRPLKGAPWAPHVRAAHRAQHH
jgi:hypothetical protein